MSDRRLAVTAVRHGRVGQLRFSLNVVRKLIARRQAEPGVEAG
jgi:hypothetical protein